MSDYKNVAMVNNPLVYWPSFTDGQLIPDPLQRYWWRARSQTANGSGISDLTVTVQSGYPTINIGCYPLIPDPLWQAKP